MNSSGWIVTSKNCSGLRRIFMVARQAMVRVWLTVSREADGRAGRSGARVAQWWR